MDRLTFRPARIEDFEPILAINGEGYPGVVRLTLAELSAVLNTAPFFYIAAIASQVAGYLIAYTDKDVYDGDEFLWFRRYFADFWYIDQIAVAPAMRRRRVASQFYEFAEQFARQHGLTSLVCEINLEPPNPISLNFHTQNQYIEVGTLDTPDRRKVSLRRKELK